MPAYGYARLSSLRGDGSEVSPETQEREVRALAARHHDDDIEWLTDWDVSGRAAFTKKRAGYLKLVDAIETGNVTAVYSYSLSRLGRSVAELSRLFDMCASRKVPIRLVADSVDTSTASGRLLANVLASVAQFEAEVAGERLRAMYETKRQRAREKGEDPRDAVRTSRRYGEAEGEDDALVLQVFRQTGSFTKASRRLNEMGVPARQGGKWWSSSVAVVVERLDPEVAGRERRPRAKAGGTGFVLARLLRCPMDESMLSGSRLPMRNGEKFVRYACRHAESTPHPRVSIAETKILPLVEREAARYREPDEDLPDPAVERAKLLERRERIVELRLDGGIDRAEAVRLFAEVDAALNALVRPPRPDLRFPRQRTPAEQNALLRLLFVSIDLDPETFLPVAYEWRDPSWREPDR